MRYLLGLTLLFAACNDNKQSNDPDGDGFTSDDCAEGDAEVYPGALELCDGKDNNCDGSIDETQPEWYADTDGDGFGDPNTALLGCTTPTGFVADATDCDDTRNDIFPGAPEVCDQADNNCDGSIDNDAPPLTWYLDGDGDGHGTLEMSQESCAQPEGYADNSDDCNDADATIYPGAPEDCDPIDRNCNTIPDDDPIDGTAYYLDGDGDNFGDVTPTIACTRPEGALDTGTDCDDSDPAVNPAALEFCDADDRDEDCDGLADDADPSVYTATYAVWYVDGDQDGYGDVSQPSTLACNPPAGYSSTIQDCNDTDASINPGAVEVDDGVDQDCDESVDEIFYSAGNIVLTEVHRQPRFGGTASVANGVWIELYNASSRSIDLSGWYFVRTNSAVGTDAFFIDPTAGLIANPGDYLVLCKTDTYASVNDAASDLNCDYVWGDPTQASNYSDRYRDNTWNPQRDDDEIQIWWGGDSATGDLMDSIHWTYDSVSGYWPRDASQSMALDPDSLDATSNDAIASWCSTLVDSAYAWYSTGAINEYGTPGAANYNCP